MLIRPSIIRMPSATYPVNPATLAGCTNGTYRAPDGSSCSMGFACKPYAPNSNDCVDCNYCGFTLAGTVAIGVTGSVVVAIT